MLSKAEEVEVEEEEVVGTLALIGLPEATPATSDATHEGEPRMTGARTLLLSSMSGRAKMDRCGRMWKTF